MLCDRSSEYHFSIVKLIARDDNFMFRRAWCHLGTYAAIIVIAGIGMHQRAYGAEGVTKPKSRDFTTVQDLYSSCTASEASVETLASLSKCVGYLNGVVDMMMVIGAAPDAAQKVYFGMCPNDAVTQGAAKQAFKNWAEKHPEMWGKDKLLGVVRALQEAWPCN